MNFFKKLQLPALADTTIKDKHWLLLLALFQIIFWVAGLVFFRHVITHDSAEAIAWGSQWQWGYDKHPPFNAWLCAAVAHIFPATDWPIYLLAELVMVATFYLVWKFAREYTTPTKAFLSALILQGIIYYNNTSENITPDTLSIPAWVLVALMYYYAVTKNKFYHWLGFGLAVATALLVKYSAVFILAPIFLASIFTYAGRQTYKTYGPYFAIAVALIALAPHIIWLVQNDFLPFNYIISDAVAGADNMQQTIPFNGMLSPHLGFPIMYLLGQLGAVIGVAVIAWPLYFSRRKDLQSLDQFQTVLLWFVALGPVVLTLVYGVAVGQNIIPRWSTPYFSFIGLGLLMLLKPTVNRAQFKAFVITAFVVALGIWVGRMAYLAWLPNTRPMNMDTYYPARNIANKMDELWSAREKMSLKYVVGSHYLVAYLNVYDVNHPIPYMDADPKQSLWINEQDLLRHGAMVAWSADEEQSKEELPLAIKKRFPTATFIGVYTFEQQFLVAPPRVTQQPTIIGFGIIKPVGNQP